jgi:hypothetical protein
MEKQRIGNTKELSEEERIKIIERSSRTVGRAFSTPSSLRLFHSLPYFFLKVRKRNYSLHWY